MELKGERSGVMRSPKYRRDEDDGSFKVQALQRGETGNRELKSIRRWNRLRSVTEGTSGASTLGLRTIY